MTISVFLKLHKYFNYPTPTTPRINTREWRGKNHGQDFCDPLESHWLRKYDRNLISTSITPVFLGLIKQGKLSEYRELILISPFKGVSSSSIHRFQEFTGILKTPYHRLF